MRARMGRGLKDLLEDVVIRRGRGVGGYQVATATNNPQIFRAIVDLDTQTDSFQQRFQDSRTLYYVMFQPKLSSFMIDGVSTALRNDDQIVRIGQMERTVKVDSETDADFLIRDIKNAKKGVLTITHIESSEKDQICRCTDITSPIGGRG